MLLHWFGLDKQGYIGHDSGHWRNVYGLLCSKQSPMKASRASLTTAEKSLDSKICLFFLQMKQESGISNVINCRMVRKRIFQLRIWYWKQVWWDKVLKKKILITTEADTPPQPAQSKINDTWTTCYLGTRRPKGMFLKTKICLLTFVSHLSFVISWIQLCC